MNTNDRSRPGDAVAWIVEDGIALAALKGRTLAAGYLVARRVPDAVIARVLCESDHRRKAPWAI
jgi:hypothetical protein